MAQIPKEEAAAINQNGAAANGGSAPEMPIVRGGAFSQAQESETPFGFGKVFLSAEVPAKDIYF